MLDIKRLLTDRKYYIESLVQIPDKTRRQVPFIFNHVQDTLYNSYITNNKIIVLKASQIGMTSCIVALFLVDCITHPHTTSVIIAHEEFITQRLLNKAKVFEASIPEQYKPTMSHRSSYELRWEDIDSTLYIGSSRSYVFGRGERIDNALCSEIAFWQDPERIMIPLLERVGSGRIILESTPNGEGNYFHSEWRKATDLYNRGLSIFKPLFFPWWENNEYRIPSGEGLPAFHTITEYTEEEQYLVSKYGLTEDQIRWRRNKLASPLGEFFFQEYPEDDVSCFLSVKESVFDVNLINEKLRQTYDPPHTYDGALVWFPPTEGHRYVIGADPTVGIHDKAAATVWDNFTLCARLSGMYDPIIFAQKIKALGKYYNNAMLVVENNNPGIAVLGYLQDYPNLYYMRDIVTGKPSGRAGWTTTSQSKTYMIQEFNSLLSQLVIPDEQLLQEAKNWRYNGLKVESMGEDDILMSSLMALATRNVTTPKPAFVGCAGWAW